MENIRACQEGAIETVQTDGVFAAIHGRNKLRQARRERAHRGLRSHGALGAFECQLRLSGDVGREGGLYGTESKSQRESEGLHRVLPGPPEHGARVVRKG
jgi:hypothetical protein